MRAIIGVIGVIGIVAMVQGALGFVGRVFFHKGWGLLPHWVALPSAAYLGIAAVGAALWAWAEADKRRRRVVR